MKYSFVLIAYNEQENIAACIDSILGQEKLGNSYEILVVDDGSRDKTAEIVMKLAKKNSKIRLIGDGKNRGRGYGRYKGVKESTGGYVIMVDADILLPKTWLATCIDNIKDHDVVGGIAVPDGDVAYIYRRFNLKPKTVMGSTTITGNNGMYKRAVFSKVNFDKNLREGEDVDFNHHAAAAGFSALCIPGLAVEHQESKSLLRSMLWLYQSGIGATRQLIRFHEVRLPDIAFAATFLTTIAATILTVNTGTGMWFIVPLLGISGASFMHTRGKFCLPLNRPLPILGALLVDMLLIFCYYAGRTIGPASLLKSHLRMAQSRHTHGSANGKKHMTIIFIPDNPTIRNRRYHIPQELVSKGHEVHFIVWDSPIHMQRKELAHHLFTSALTRHYPYKELTVHKFGRLPLYWPYINGLLFKFQLRHLYKQLDADLVITESYTNETEVPKSLPFIYDMADDYAAPADLYGSPIYKLAFRMLDVKGTMKRQCKNALAVTALSDILVSFAKQYNKNVLKLPSGIDQDPVIAALGDKSTYPQNDHTIIYVSGFQQWSRSIETLQTVVELREEFPDIDLTLIGPGIEVESIKNFIKDNHVEDFIHYLGPIYNRKRLFRLINKCTVGLNISQKNTFRDACHPAKVIDYSAMGKKIVSTNLAEVEALNFPNIFIFNDSREGPTLKDTMRQALLHKVGKKGYPEISSHVLEEYNWGKITDKLLGLIDDVNQVETEGNS